MNANVSLISELEDALNTASEDRRVETLRRVTDLFLGGANRLNDMQIELFDDVLLYLIKRIETKALVELSTRLAPVESAPIEVIRHLARSDEIAVAGPVLSQSPRLTTTDLVEIAESKSLQHLLAISGRSQLQEAVTDVLLDRGNQNIVHRVAMNAGARFSESGFTNLLKNAETDESLAAKIGLRLDIPLHVLKALLVQATEAVRSQLLANTSSEHRDEIRRMLANISTTVCEEAAAPRDFTEAFRLAQSMHNQGELDEAALLEFADNGKYEEVVAALSILSSASLAVLTDLMRSHRYDGLLVVCKAAGIKWPAVTAILNNFVRHHAIASLELANAKTDYFRLSQANAQRILRFWQVRVGTRK
jgi:uncharacterized protein (DUF2336 family)